MPRCSEDHPARLASPSRDVGDELRFPSYAAREQVKHVAPASCTPETHENPAKTPARRRRAPPAAGPRPLGVISHREDPVSEGRQMPHGVRTHAGRARSEHLAPRSQGWSRSEGCPPTLRRASEHLGGSPQGPQRRGVGGGHGAPPCRAPSVRGRARSACSTGRRGLSSLSSGKTEPLAARVRAAGGQPVF